MADQRNVGTIDFKGIHRRINQTKLELSQFNEDLNGSRYQDRTWRVRLGLCKAASLGASQGNPITAISHFLGQDGRLKLTFVQDGVYEGFDQPDPDCDVGIVELRNDLYSLSETAGPPAPSLPQIDSHDGPGGGGPPPWEEEPPEPPNPPPDNFIITTTTTHQNEGGGALQIDADWDVAPSPNDAVVIVERDFGAFDITGGGAFTTVNADISPFDDVGGINPGYTAGIQLEDGAGNTHIENIATISTPNLPVPAPPIPYATMSFALADYAAGGVNLADIQKIRYRVQFTEFATQTVTFLDDLRVS